jgi:hypothetical protein
MDGSICQPPESPLSTAMGTRRAVPAISYGTCGDLPSMGFTNPVSTSTLVNLQSKHFAFELEDAVRFDNLHSLGDGPSGETTDTRVPRVQLHLEPLNFSTYGYFQFLKVTFHLSLTKLLGDFSSNRMALDLASLRK